MAMIWPQAGGDAPSACVLRLSVLPAYHCLESCSPWWGPRTRFARCRYEDVLRAPKKELKAMLDFVGLEVPLAQIDAAVAQSPPTTSALRAASLARSVPQYLLVGVLSAMWLLMVRVLKSHQLSIELPSKVPLITAPPCCTTGGGVRFRVAVGRGRRLRG